MSTTCDNCRVDVERRKPRSGPPWSDRFPIGQERGSQRDPVTAELILCGPCQECLGGMIGGESTPIDLARFHERWSVAHGHFTCREATALVDELIDRGYRLVLTVGPDPFGDPGEIDTYWNVRVVGERADAAEGALSGVVIADAVREAYNAARGGGWPDDEATT